ncbi:HisA/HisF-related TIM barrel protein [Bacteroidota bacterium]
MQKILVIPSIDIKDGKTVRVVQGIPELNCNTYADDPVEMAMLWRAENAKCIHVVDFNASWYHSHENYDLIEQICNSVIIPVQLAGGIRTIEDVEDAFRLGAYRVIIGTMAHENRKEFIKIIDRFGANKISAAIDIIDDEVIIRSRKKRIGIKALDYAVNLKEIGVERIIVTDISKNGMLTGPNVSLSRSIADATGAKITLSGGVGGIKDLMMVQDEVVHGIDSVIIGRALYENKFSCQKIWRVAESGIFN